MHITVHYLTQIRRAAGCSSESITVPDGCTLDALLHQLAERREPGFGRFGGAQRRKGEGDGGGEAGEGREAHGAANLRT